MSKKQRALTGQKNCPRQFENTDQILDMDHEFHIYWNLLNACPYSCGDCLTRQATIHDHFDRHTAFDIAHGILSLPMPRISLDIQGGEPTLHPFLPHILRFVLEADRNVIVRLHTNGWNDIAWYVDLFQNIPKSKFSIQLWPKPEFSDLKHLLILCGMALEKGIKLGVTLPLSSCNNYNIFNKAFTELSSKFPVSFSHDPQDTSKKFVSFFDKTIREKDFAHKLLRENYLPLFNPLIINSAGSCAVCTDNQAGHTAEKLKDCLLEEKDTFSCKNRGEECPPPIFGTKNGEGKVIKNFRRAAMRYMWTRRPFLNPASPRIDPAQSLMARLKRILQTEPPDEYIQRFFTHAEWIASLYGNLADGKSRERLIKWLAVAISTRDIPPLAMPARKERGYIGLIGRPGVGTVIYSDLAANGADLDGQSVPDAKAATEFLAGIYGRCGKFYMDGAPPELFPAALNAIQWHKPETWLALPSGLEPERIPDFHLSLDDYIWTIEADAEIENKFWLKGARKVSDRLPPKKSVDLTIAIMEEDVAQLMPFCEAYPSLDILVFVRGELSRNIPPNARVIQVKGLSSKAVLDSAIDLARNGYLCFVDHSFQITEKFITSFCDIEDKPDIIIFDKPDSAQIVSSRSCSILSGLCQPMIHKVRYLRDFALSHCNVEPLERALFNMETLSRTANVRHLPSLNENSVIPADKTPHCGTYLGNLGELALNLDILFRARRDFSEAGAKNALVAEIMEIFWPHVTAELAKARENATLFEITTEETFRKIGSLPEIIRWLINELAEKEYASISGGLTYDPEEREKYLLEKNLVDNPKSRPAQEWEEYISPFADSHPQTPLLSVIMPNFNKMEYVGEAIGSVLDQGFTEFELLIVDDASTDGGYEICQDYADFDKRVRLWRMRHNSLQGVCRNLALAQARGRYIVFVDSDDLLHPNFLERAVVDIKNSGADMAIYGMQEIDMRGDVVKVVKPEKGELKGQGICTAFWADRFPWGPWAKIYDADLIKRANIRFAEYIYHQDVFFLHEFSLAASKIIILDDIAYSCRLTSNSSVRPAKHGYTHLHSAIAKLELRNAAYQRGDINLDWQRVAKDAIYTLQIRILPAIARAFGMFGHVPLADSDLKSLCRNPVFLFVLFTRHVYEGMHNKKTDSAPEPGKDRADSPELRRVMENFALADVRLLENASRLADPGPAMDAQIQFIKSSGLFNEKFYLAANDDLQQGPVDPASHFCERWRLETWRNPAPWFSTKNYLDAYPDVANADINPFIHFLRSGYKEGRSPWPERATLEGAPLYNRDFDSLLNFRPGPGTILLVEANNCHCDIPPGIANYLVELGFKVNVVILPSQAALDPFCRWTRSGLSCWTLPFHEISWLLQNGPHTHEYEYIFFNSYTLYKALNGVDRPSVFDHFPNLIRAKHGAIAVMHHYELWDPAILPRSRIMTLSDVGGADLVVNPHRFGEVRVTGKQDGRAHFIVVGALEPDRRNVPLLFEAAQTLLNEFIDSFYISIIGRGIVARPQNLAKYSELLGEATYREMFKKMEDANFFLPLLDPENPDHERYLKTAISGSFMLCYCFRKPLIVAEKFAEKYGLNEENSILYKTNADLAQAMKRAINMPYGEYKKMRDNLAKVADSIAEKSLENLRRILGG